MGVQKLIGRVELAKNLKVQYRPLKTAIEELNIALHDLPHSSRGKGVNAMGVRRLTAYFKKKKAKKCGKEG